MVKGNHTWNVGQNVEKAPIPMQSNKYFLPVSFVYPSLLNQVKHFPHHFRFSSSHPCHQDFVVQLHFVFPWKRCVPKWLFACRFHLKGGPIAFHQCRRWSNSSHRSYRPSCNQKYNCLFQNTTSFLFCISPYNTKHTGFDIYMWVSALWQAKCDHLPSWQNV